MIQAAGNNSAPTAYLPDMACDASAPDETAPNGTALAQAREAVDDRFARRRIRTASRSAGFFTLGFAIAVLAAGSLFAGAMGERDVADSASAATPTEVAGERRQPAGSGKTEGASNVVISEASSASPKRAPAVAASPQ
jgi:hypothetical protein